MTKQIIFLVVSVLTLMLVAFICWCTFNILCEHSVSVWVLFDMLLVSVFALGLRVIYGHFKSHSDSKENCVTGFFRKTKSVLRKNSLIKRIFLVVLLAFDTIFIILALFCSIGLIESAFGPPQGYGGLDLAFSMIYASVFSLLSLIGFMITTAYVNKAARCSEYATTDQKVSRKKRILFIIILIELIGLLALIVLPVVQSMIRDW